MEDCGSFCYSLQRTTDFILVFVKEKKHSNTRDFASPDFQLCSLISVACHETERKTSASDGGCFYNQPVLGSLIRSEAFHTFLRHERSGRRLVTAASSPPNPNNSSPILGLKI